MLLYVVAKMCFVAAIAGKHVIHIELHVGLATEVIV